MKEIHDDLQVCHVNMWFVLYTRHMQTTISKRGQTVVPAEIRHQYGLGTGDTLVWINDGRTIRVVPVPSRRESVIDALHGRGKGENLVGKLIEARKADRTRK